MMIYKLKNQESAWGFEYLFSTGNRVLSASEDSACIDVVDGEIKSFMREDYEVVVDFEAKEVEKTLRKTISAIEESTGENHWSCLWNGEDGQTNGIGLALGKGEEHRVIDLLQSGLEIREATTGLKEELATRDCKTLAHNYKSIMECVDGLNREVVAYLSKNKITLH